MVWKCIVLHQLRTAGPNWLKFFVNCSQLNVFANEDFGKTPPK